jgi:hypothetical protein
MLVKQQHISWMVCYGYESDRLCRRNCPWCCLLDVHVEGFNKSISNNDIH